MKRTEGEIGKYSYISEDYESFHELKSINDNRPYIWGHDAHHCQEATPGNHVSQEYSFDQIFHGSNLFDQWYRDAKAESDRALKTFLKEFKGSRAVKDYVGSSVNVARALQGHPKSFSHRIPDVKKKKALQLDWDTAVRWGYSCENRIKNACIFVAVAKALEVQGYAVKITACNTTAGDNDDLTITTVPLKDYHTPVNEKKMLYPLGAKASLFHVFVWADQKTPGSKRKGGDGRSVFFEGKDNYEKVVDHFAKQGRILLSHTLVDKEVLGDGYSADFNMVLSYILEKAAQL